MPTRDENPIEFTNQPVVECTIRRLPHAPSIWSRPTIPLHFGPSSEATIGWAAPEAINPSGNAHSVVSRSVVRNAVATSSDRLRMRAKLGQVAWAIGSTRKLFGISLMRYAIE